MTNITKPIIRGHGSVRRHGRTAMGAMLTPARPWRIQMGAMEAARRAVDQSRLMEIRYEDFCERPKETFRDVLEFFELRSSPVLDAHVAAAPIRNTSNDALTAAQQHILEDLLRDDLRRYGYGAPEEAEQLRGTVAR
jgi:hypothetical protein